MLRYYRWEIRTGKKKVLISFPNRDSFLFDMSRSEQIKANATKASYHRNDKLNVESKCKYWWERRDEGNGEEACE